MNQNTALKYAIAFLILAVIIFLLAYKRDEKDRDMIESVNSTISFGEV